VVEDHTAIVVQCGGYHIINIAAAIVDADRSLKPWFDTCDYIQSILFYQIITSANVFVSFSVFCVGA